MTIIEDGLIGLIKRYGYACGALALTETPYVYAAAERHADALLAEIREQLPDVAAPAAPAGGPDTVGTLRPKLARLAAAVPPPAAARPAHGGYPDAAPRCTCDVHDVSTAPGRHETIRGLTNGCGVHRGPAGM